MIRKIIFIYVLAFFIIPVTAFGEESSDSPSESRESTESESGEEELRYSYLKDDFQFTFNAGVGFTTYQWEFTGGFQFDFNANPVIGAGVKTTVDYGLKYGNLNINLYALYKVWWFYVGPGVSFIVRGMTIPADDPDYVRAYSYQSAASLALTGGLRFPFVRMGPGFLTMDVSIDWYQTDIPLSQPTPPYSGNTLDELIKGTVYAFKFAARLGYTF